MNFGIRNIFTRGVKNPDPVKNDQPTVADVWKSPALFNRETRRRAGLLSRFWRWDTQGIPEMRRTFVPRYIRRHFKAETMLAPTTRRQRKVRARIMRATKQAGIL